MFSKGDVIRVIEDIALCHELQQNHGEWNDDMALVSEEIPFINEEPDLQDYNMPCVVSWPVGSCSQCV